MKLVWWGVVALSLAAIASVWLGWSGPCWGVGTDMTCDLDPNVGWPTSIGVSVVAAVAIAASVIVLRRKSAPTVDVS